MSYEDSNEMDKNITDFLKMPDIFEQIKQASEKDEKYKDLYAILNHNKYSGALNEMNQILKDVQLSN